MPIKYAQRARICEGILLLLVAPFLLFPQYLIFITLLALLLVAVLWIWPVLLLDSTLIPTTPFNVALLLFMVMVVVSIVVSADPDLTLPKATGIILGVTLWRYLVVHYQTRRQVTWVVLGYIVLGFGFTLVGLLNANWALKVASEVSLLQRVSTKYVSQLASFLSIQTNVHPNQISAAIMLFLPLLISILTTSPDFKAHRYVKASLLGMAILTTIALILTQSRSGWIGLTCGLLSILMMRGLLLPPSRKRTMVWITTGVVLLAGLLLVMQIGPRRLQQYWLDPMEETSLGSISTLTLRKELWPWSLMTISNFPFTGVGLGSFRRVARNLYPLNIPLEFDFAHAHNMFLQVAVDIGIPGLISYLSLLIISGVIAWTIAKRNRRMQSVSLGLFACLIAFHTFGLVDALSLGSKPGLFLWVIFGLFAIINLTENRDQYHEN